MNVSQRLIPVPVPGCRCRLVVTAHKYIRPGQDPTLVASEDDCSNIVAFLSYWRSTEHLHTFAQSDIHRAGWDWYNAHAKQYPHIGIAHEVYSAPKGHWENITHNMKPFGIGEGLGRLTEGRYKTLTSSYR